MSDKKIIFELPANQEADELILAIVKAGDLVDAISSAFMAEQACSREMTRYASCKSIETFGIEIHARLALGIDYQGMCDEVIQWINRPSNEPRERYIVTEDDRFREPRYSGISAEVLVSEWGSQPSVTLSAIIEYEYAKRETIPHRAMDFEDLWESATPGIYQEHVWGKYRK